jgi:urease accessory protein
VLTLTEGALQALLQLTNGGLPTGAFSHSYGLEAAVQEGEIHDAATFGEWLEVHLTCGVGPADGAAVRLVQLAAAAADWDTVAKLDRLLVALKLAPEVRAASLATGQALLRAAREVFPGERIERYAALLARGEACGNAAAVFACVAADLGLPPAVSVVAYLWTVAASLTGVATRLIPLGAIAAQRVLREAQPWIRGAAIAAERRDERTLGGFTIGQDIAALRHERLYSRLFMS